jgi:hypothetical protein
MGQPVSETGGNEAAEKQPLPPAAARALAEAAARRAEGKCNARTIEGAKEVGGRDGPEPTRYGDWEVNGLASDF